MRPWARWLYRMAGPVPVDLDAEQELSGRLDLVARYPWIGPWLFTDPELVVGDGNDPEDPDHMMELAAQLPVKEDPGVLCLAKAVLAAYDRAIGDRRWERREGRLRWSPGRAVRTLADWWPVVLAGLAGAGWLFVPGQKAAWAWLAVVGGWLAIVDLVSATIPLSGILGLWIGVPVLWAQVPDAGVLLGFSLLFSIGSFLFLQLGRLAGMGTAIGGGDLLIVPSVIWLAGAAGHGLETGLWALCGWIVCLLVEAGIRHWWIRPVWNGFPGCPSMIVGGLLAVLAGTVAG